VYLLYLHVTRSNLNFDKVASKILEDGSLPLNAPIIVYLRPFVTDGKLPIQLNSVSETISTMFFLGLDRAGGFESKLRSVLKYKFNLVRLDDDDDKNKNFWKEPVTSIESLFGHRIGKYDTNKESWLLFFIELTHKAFAFLVVPPHSTSSSTCGEIIYLIDNGFQSKTIFIMPGSNLKIGGSAKNKVSAKSLWENLVNTIGGKVILPDYSKSGGFVIYIQGKYKLVEGVSGNPWHSEKAIKCVVEGGGITDPPWKDSVRVMIRLVWITCTIGFIACVIISKNLPENIGESERILVATAIVIYFALIDFYRYLKCFMLQIRQVWLLLFMSIVSLILGVVTFDYIDPPPLETLDGIYQLFPIFALYILASSFVYGAAYFIFSMRKNISFYPNKL